MKSRLPSNLNPNRFKDTVDVYSDDYKDRFSIDSGHWGFLIENKVPFTIYLAVGINGEDLEERTSILELLRIAHSIQRETGRWPELETEWEDMCPGGLLKLDVTPFAAIPSSSPSLPLPQVLRMICGRLERAQNSMDAAFADAERHYQKELKGLEAFNDAIRTMQREFDAHPLCVLNVNTKARRLRYVTVLAHFAKTVTDSTRLTNAVLNWAAEHTEALQVHKDSKGAVLPSTGVRSVLPYLNLAKELSFLKSVGRRLALTNTGRVLTMVSQVFDEFSLGTEERLYFLFDLLNHDRDLLCPLIIQLSDGGVQRKRDIRKAFPDVYKEHLTRLREQCGTVRSRRQVDAALERVAHWRSAETYMEHVVDPRISWLVDLDLCTLEGDQVSLTKRGASFATALAEFGRSNLFVITGDFLRRRYFNSIARTVEPRDDSPKRERPSEGELIPLLRECCEFVRKNTTSLVPNRIVASTLFRYTGLKLFIEHRIAADFSDLLKLFSNEEKASKIGWRLRWQAAQEDGYLTPI